MPLDLSDDTRRELVASIQAYFRDERDETIGDLQAGFFLDFALQTIGPVVYDRAVRDAQARLRAIVDDLDVNLPGI